MQLQQQLQQLTDIKEKKNKRDQIATNFNRINNFLLPRLQHLSHTPMKTETFAKHTLAMSTNLQPYRQTDKQPDIHTKQIDFSKKKKQVQLINFKQVVLMTLFEWKTNKYHKIKV